jgi:hypothetical protein
MKGSVQMKLGTFKSEKWLEASAEDQPAGIGGKQMPVTAVLPLDQADWIVVPETPLEERVLEGLLLERLDTAWSDVRANYFPSITESRSERFIHASGALYEWEMLSAPGEQPVAPLPEWMLQLLTQGPADRETEDTEETEETEASAAGVPLDNPLVAPIGPPLSVRDAIFRTLPMSEGQRNRCIFEFARALKAIPSLADAPLSALKPHVRAWHKEALPVIGTKAFDATWSEFCYAWPRAKVPWGISPVMLALAKADSTSSMIAVQYDTPATRRLVKLCRELQRGAGDSPFFLSCRAAAVALGIDHNTANKLLAMIQADGIIVCVAEGTKKRARRFRYVAADLADDIASDAHPS